MHANEPRYLQRLHELRSTSSSEDKLVVPPPRVQAMEDKVENKNKEQKFSKALQSSLVKFSKSKVLLDFWSITSIDKGDGIWHHRLAGSINKECLTEEDKGSFVISVVIEDIFTTNDLPFWVVENDAKQIFILPKDNERSKDEKFVRTLQIYRQGLKEKGLKVVYLITMTDLYEQMNKGDK